MGKLSLAGEFPKVDDAAWRALAEKALKGADFDKSLVSTTYDGLNVKPLYTRSDESKVDASGVPGSSPYTRGFSADRHDPPWQIRQLHAAPGAAEANAAILSDLEGGVTAIALQIAAPGQTGVPVSSVEDLDRALDGVALDLAGVWLEAGHNAVRSANLLQELWKNRSLDTDKIRGGFGADALGTLAITGGHPLSLAQAFEEMSDLAKATHEKLPHVTAIRADARPYHGGGGSDAQELACLCATVVAYLRALETGGLAPKDGLRQIELTLACDQDFFTNIAKLRAARALIARIADAAGASNAAQGLRLHAMTSFRMFARHDPHVNILRTTIACAAAALGGADAITVLPYMYANGQPNAFSRRIARNIQIVLQEEASLGAVIDPAGGSWYVEDFTKDLAETAWDIFQEIEKQGGMVEALAKGFVQKMLAETAKKRARDVALGIAELTGVSSFSNLSESSAEVEPHAVPRDLDDPAITVEPVPLRRPAEPFETLRDASDAYLQSHGQRPKAALIPLGEESHHADAVTDARRFFAAGGIEAQIVQASAYDPALSPVACICAGSAETEKEGADAAKKVRGAGAQRVYAVGRPGELRKELRDAGIDQFLHRGCDMIEILEDAHDVLGLKQH